MVQGYLEQLQNFGSSCGGRINVGNSRLLKVKDVTMLIYCSSLYGSKENTEANSSLRITAMILVYVGREKTS